MYVVTGVILIIFFPHVATNRYRGGFDGIIVKQVVVLDGKTHYPKKQTMGNSTLYMGQVTKLWLPCYLVLLSNDNKTR